jgi:hypothetical protein
MKLPTIYILAANLGCLLIINVITISILLNGGVLLVEPNLAIIAGETVGTLLITSLTVAWLLQKIRAIGKPKRS